MVFLLILVFVIIIWLEVPNLVKQKMWRELAAFAGITLLAMYFSFAQVLNFPVFNPVDVLDAVFGPIGNYLKNL